MSALGQLFKPLDVIGRDKLLHFITGQVLALAVLPFGLLKSILLTVLAGALKEIHDHFHPEHQAEWWDLIATILGGLPVWLVFWLGGGR